MKELVEILVTASLTILVNQMNIDDWLKILASVILLGACVFSWTILRGLANKTFSWKTGFDRPVVFHKRKRRNT